MSSQELHFLVGELIGEGDKVRCLLPPRGTLSPDVAVEDFPSNCALVRGTPSRSLPSRSGTAARSDGGTKMIEPSPETYPPSVASVDVEPEQAVNEPRAIITAMKPGARRRMFAPRGLLWIFQGTR